jgi:hypothetical protein
MDAGKFLFARLEDKQWHGDWLRVSARVFLRDVWAANRWLSRCHPTGKAIARVTIKEVPKSVVDCRRLCCSFERVRPLYSPFRSFQTAFDG